MRFKSVLGGTQLLFTKADERRKETNISINEIVEREACQEHAPDPLEEHKWKEGAVYTCPIWLWQKKKKKKKKKPQSDLQKNGFK